MAKARQRKAGRGTKRGPSFKAPKLAKRQHTKRVHSR